jgi:hypothetical protein
MKQSITQFEFPHLAEPEKLATACRVLRGLLRPGDRCLNETERDALETVLRHVEKT